VGQNQNRSETKIVCKKERRICRDGGASLKVKTILRVVKFSSLLEEGFTEGGVSRQLKGLGFYSKAIGWWIPSMKTREVFRKTGGQKKGRKNLRQDDKVSSEPEELRITWSTTVNKIQGLSQSKKKRTGRIQTTSIKGVGDITYRTTHQGV